MLLDDRDKFLKEVILLAAARIIAPIPATAEARQEY